MTTEEKLKEMLGDYYEMGVPGSPNAAILQNMLGADNELRDPQSENEALLKLIYEDVIGAVYDARDEAQAAAAQAGTAAEAVANKAPAIVDTASGSIASFPDGADGVEIKSATVQIVPKQSGTGDPSPDNVRAITGWDAVTVTGCGKNLLGHDGENLPFSQRGVTVTRTGSEYTVTVESSSSGHPYALIGVLHGIKAGTYYLSANGIPSTIPNNNFGIRLVNRAVSPAVYYVATMNGASFTVSNDVTDSVNIELFITPANVPVGTYTITAQLELGSTDTDYEPYTGQTYDISWESEAGTVYGGTLTYEGDGVWTVTVDRGAVDLGSLTWTRRGTYAMQSNGLAALITQPAANIDPNLVCSIAKSSNWTAFVSAGPSAGLVATSGGYIAVSADATDPAVWKASVTGQTLVYPLATPQTYTLTTEQVVTLLGQNNFWADCGDSSVTYRADIQLYINKILGSSETDMVADTNIESGKYFFIGGQLYLSTAAIAAGSTIIPGTNCTATNVAEALNIINA